MIFSSFFLGISFTQCTRHLRQDLQKSAYYLNHPLVQFILPVCIICIAINMFEVCLYASFHIHLGSCLGYHNCVELLFFSLLDCQG